MGSMPCSIGPEDSPGKIILASQGLKRVQAEVKIKQNQKANVILKENSDFHSKIIFAEQTIRSSFVLYCGI